MFNLGRPETDLLILVCTKEKKVTYIKKKLIRKNHWILAFPTILNFNGYFSRSF